MTLAGLTLPGTDRSSRWLLMGSLALNLFFIGAGGAVLLRGYQTAPAPASIHGDYHKVAARIERIAARLPQQDADKLLADFRAHRGEIESAEATYSRMREDVRATLRAEPFSTDAMRAAMVKLRTARQTFDVRLQDFFANFASQMSPEGRRKLADWRHQPPRPASGK